MARWGDVSWVLFVENDAMTFYQPGLGKSEPFSHGLLMALLGCLTPACLTFSILAFLAPLFGPEVDYRYLALVLFAPAAAIALMALGQALWRSIPMSRGSAEVAKAPTILWGSPAREQGQILPEADLVQRIS